MNNRNNHDPAEPTWLPAHFEARAAQSPDRLALVGDGVSVTYAELNRRANQLAFSLRGRGVRPDERVGLLAERSVELLTGILGIWKAGAAYLPIDPDHPEERVQRMLAHGGCRVLVTQMKFAGAARSGDEVLILEDPASYAGEGHDLERVGGAGDLAYAIYTSGSTGTPKGVMITHANVLNYAKAAMSRFQLPEGLSFAMLSSAAADLGNTAFLAAWLTGGTVHVLSSAEAANGQAFLAALRAGGIQFLKITPSHFSALTDGGSAGELPLRWLVFGGEPLPPELVARFSAANPGCAVFNHYGPTETTVGVVAGRVTPERVALGRPLPRVPVYLLDSGASPVRVGAVGEICVGGAAVGRGYLDQPTLTAERFVADPFAAGGRMYRTGDLARWLPDKNIEFIGRADDQVKVRGFRVELGEIETAVRSHPAVTNAVAVCRAERNAEARLWAYYTCREELAPKALDEHLRKLLPDYMQPSGCICLTSLPLLRNGKVDRRRLPSPERIGSDYEEPVGPVETELCRLFAECLGAERVGRNDDFFTLGGSSLSGIRLMTGIGEAFAVELTLPQLLENANIKDLANMIATAAQLAQPAA